MGIEIIHILNREKTYLKHEKDILNIKKAA